MKVSLLVLFLGAMLADVPAISKASPNSRPNILFCTSDDQSWHHTGAGGDRIVATPAFDRVAREGVRFTHAFSDAPSCAPSRNAIFTGQHIWRLEEGGNIHSTLPAKFPVYPDLLEEAGYVVGYTGKAWGPGRLEPGGRNRNPTGPKFKSFADFLENRPSDRPFSFWLGSSHPHRAYPLDSGLKSGKKIEDVRVPYHLPDHPVVRSDILDYLTAIEKFDRKVEQALALLDRTGLAENTLVVVTSDHGMPFPRAKASLYDYGSRVPLAMRWPGGIDPGRVVDDFVVLSDLAPTFLDVAGLEPPSSMTARSLARLMAAQGSGRIDPARDQAYFGMERHDGCRRGGKGYPCRALRTPDYLYIRNFEPTRWPAGDPDASNCARAIPYGEVDPSPSKSLLMEHREEEEFVRFFELAFAKRRGEELYDLRVDPGQLSNVAAHPRYLEIKSRLAKQLDQHLRQTGDPRATGKPAPWDHYPYYGRRVNKDWEVGK